MKLKNIIEKTILTGLVIVCALTITGYLSKLWWCFEVTSHFRVQYFYILFIFSIVYFFRKKYKIGFTFLTFSLINFSFFYQLYFAENINIETSNSYRAILSNVENSNRNYDQFFSFIKNMDPDFIVINEVNSHWNQQLKKLESIYPYNKTLLHTSEAWGLAFYSRYQPKEINKINLGAMGLPGVVSTYHINGERFVLMGVHLHSPEGADSLDMRTQEMLEVAVILEEHKDENIILLGDLNTTSFSPYYNDFILETNLRDSRKGFGILPTWPVWLPLLGVAIDHCLVSDKIIITNRETGSDIGSDHYPLIVDFEIPKD